MVLSPTLNKTRKGIFGTEYPGMQQPEPQQPMPMGQQGQSMAVPAQPQVQSPSFFGEGGVGRAIAGNIGDAMLQFAQMNPIYAPVMQQRQAMQHHAQQRQAKRLEDMEDFRAKREYERENPAPQMHKDNAGNLFNINPVSGERQLLYRDPNAKRIPQKVFGPNGEEYIEHIEVPNMVNEDGSFRNAGPAVGTIDGEHRFKGGDPASQDSWEPVGGASDDEAADILSRASATRTISPGDLARVQASLGPNGQAASQQWLRRYGIRVGGQ